MLIFLNQFNKGILGIEAKEEYIRFFEEDTKKRNKELEYIILILDRFINEKKASQCSHNENTNLFLDKFYYGYKGLPHSQYKKGSYIFFLRVICLI